MTTDTLETGARPWTKATRESVTDTEQNQRRPHSGAYNDFPNGPIAYRDQTDATLERLFRAATSHAQDRINWYDEKSSERSRVAKNIRSLSLSPMTDPLPTCCSRPAHSHLSWLPSF
jgi:hypothetical protein